MRWILGFGRNRPIRRNLNERLVTRVRHRNQTICCRPTSDIGVCGRQGPWWSISGRSGALCKIIPPFPEDIANEMKGWITVAKLNIDGNPVTRAKYGVNGQIDRIVVTDDSVLVVDYKTLRPPPAS